VFKGIILPIIIVINHRDIRKEEMMRKVLYFLALSLFAIGNVNAEEITVIAGDNSDPNNSDYYIGTLDTETGNITRVKSIPHQTAFAPGLSTADPVTGKVYNFDNSSPGTGFSIYDSQTNTTTRPTATLGAQIFAVLPTVKPKGVDGVISLTNDDAEIKIDETNNTVNIDNAAISDGDGKNIIAVKNDGAVHIGENSLVTIEQNGRQYLYGTDASGSMIDLDIMAGSDFRIHGISVLDSLRGLGDGVEGSAALTAALSSVPSSAPDYEYYCGGGLGAYGSSQAAALGCAKDHSETLSFHAGASYLLGGGEAYGVDKFSDFAFKAGFTYKFGKKSKSNPVETASLNAAALSASSTVEQTKLKAQVNDLSHKLAISTGEQTKLKAQVNDLSHTLAVLAKKLEVNTASINSGSQMDKVAMAR
jgi:hypothetical protein